MNFYFYVSKIATPLIVPSNFIIFFLILSFYFGFYRKKNFFIKFFKLFFIIFSVISITPVGHNLVYFFLEKDFYNSKIPNKVDYIFVISGSPSRIIKAIDLKNNLSLKEIKIIYSSGIAYLDKKNSKDVEIDFVEKMILNSKIDKNHIIFLPKARNTYENFKRLNEFLIEEDKKESKILLVTSAFHINRSLLMAKKYKLDISSYPSEFITKKYSVGIVNSYQRINFLYNLRAFDIFVKELISTTFSKFL